MIEIHDVIVVGGGASGMMAAISAARKGMRVLLVEKNKKLGNKLSISGGGRCNITNATYDVRDMLKNYGNAEKFLYSAFEQFSVQDTFSFFENLGLPLVVEARNRAFPKTQKAPDVVKVLEQELNRLGVTTVLGESVAEIVMNDNKIESIKTKKNTYIARNYIFATGGLSHPETGSTGDGYAWLRKLGHRVVDPTPSLVPLACDDAWVHELSGMAFENARIVFFVDGVRKFAKVGKVLCAHFGLSGPQILNMSAKIADLLHEGDVTARINIFPDLDEKQLDTKILKIFDAHKNKMLKSVLKEFLSGGLATVFAEHFLTAKDLETPVHSVPVTVRKSIVKTLQALPVHIIGLMGYDRAIIADGGVTLDEIDMRTMKSKKCSNLSITGDLLHIMRPSGGFSLQLCWTTGFVAGDNV